MAFDLMQDDDELDQLRALARAKFRQNAIEQAPANETGDTLQTLAAGLTDVFSKGASMPSPVDFITGIKTPSIEPTNALDSLQKKRLANSQALRQKALDNFSQLKELENIANLRADKKANVLDKQEMRDIQRSTAESNATLKGLALGLQGKKLQDWVDLERSKLDAKTQNDLNQLGFKQDQLIVGGRQKIDQIHAQGEEARKTKQTPGAPVQLGQKDFQSQAEKLGKDLNDPQRIDQQFKEIEGLIGKNLDSIDSKKFDLPGKVNLLTGQTISFYDEKARKLDTALASLMNARIKDAAGSAVTGSEFNRIQAEYANKPFRTEQEKIYALQRLKRALYADVNNLEAKYNPSAVSLYKQRGGIIPTGSFAVPQDKVRLTQEQREALKAKIRARSGG